MSNTITLAAVWQDYNNTVVLKNDTEIQRIEIKAAFYSGAYIMLMKILQLGRSNQPEDVSLLEVNTLLQECQEFFKKHT